MNKVRARRQKKVDRKAESKQQTTLQLLFRGICTKRKHCRETKHHSILGTTVYLKSPEFVSRWGERIS